MLGLIEALVSLEDSLECILPIQIVTWLAVVLEQSRQGDRYVH